MSRRRRGCCCWVSVPLCQLSSSSYALRSRMLHVVAESPQFDGHCFANHKASVSSPAMMPEMPGAVAAP